MKNRGRKRRRLCRVPTTVAVSPLCFGFDRAMLTVMKFCCKMGFDKGAYLYDVCSGWGRVSPKIRRKEQGCVNSECDKGGGGKKIRTFQDIIYISPIVQLSTAHILPSSETGRQFVCMEYYSRLSHRRVVRGDETPVSHATPRHMQRKNQMGNGENVFGGH